MESELPLFSDATQLMICYGLCITSSIILICLRHPGAGRNRLFRRMTGWTGKSPGNGSTLKAIASGYMLLFSVAGFLACPRMSFPWTVCLAVTVLNYANVMETVLTVIARHWKISFILPSVLMAAGIRLPWLLGISFIYDVLTLLAWYIHHPSRLQQDYGPGPVNTGRSGIRDYKRESGTPPEVRSRPEVQPDLTEVAHSCPHKRRAEARKHHPAVRIPDRALPGHTDQSVRQYGHMLRRYRRERKGGIILACRRTSRWRKVRRFPSKAAHRHHLILHWKTSRKKSRMA